MRIGLFTASQWRADENPKVVLADLRQQIRTARDNGFSALLLGQHVVSGPMGMYQTMPMLGHVAEDAAGMQIGPGVLLLSMMNPVLAAEEGATIDWMSDGNYVLAAGLGYRLEEFQAMGVDIKNRVGRLTEGLEIIKRLWTEEEVNHDGRYFQLTGAKAGVRPKQQPRPPIWLGGDVEPAVRRAARLADAWLAAPTTTFERVAEFIGAFRDERKQAGLAEDVKCPIVRECFIGRDAAHAREISRGPLLAKYAAYASWGQEGAAAGDFETAFDDFSAAHFLIGDAIEVRDRLQQFAEATGSDQFLMRVQWPGLEQSEVLANIERIAKLI
ncbi:MAG: LLM class flavin-dependent oxidoreductase [Alphaproteobacteria bacterium]|jgi:alkanesulfonate monooxygenase SsuD/methylene tetrahydromethanopterin reductase-like flavin-dependent oxidoreductase (luciferase family)|nr:LLM class flavin-dependent oxidoreductase [Alphaproteobacteria bacterium]